MSGGIVRSKTTRSWNATMRSFGTAQPHLCLLSYVRMRQAHVSPDHHTFPLLLKATTKLLNQNPFQLFSHILKFGFQLDLFVRNSLISAFANHGHVESARQVFDEGPERDAVAYTAMLDGYIKNGRALEALRCFVSMRSTGISVDEVTVVSILSAAGMERMVWFGRWAHGFYVIQRRAKWDLHVGSALIDMYCKCGYSEDAHKVFEEMPIRNIVSWSALIAGYVHCSRFSESLVLFQEMLLEGTWKPSHFTLTSLLTACAQSGDLDQGRCIHAYMGRNGFDINTALGTALIDMYSKCGCLNEALKIFERLPLGARNDVYPWTAMLNGLAMHGKVAATLGLFRRMLQSGVRPNDVTFISVLSACAHGGLVEEGRELFRLMRESFGLEPTIYHYGCMVDLLGRAGQLLEARKLIEEIPMEPNPGVWGALLGACLTHNEFELGLEIGERLIRMDPDHSGSYALLANMYLRCGNRELAGQVRKLMKGRGVEKAPGCSWIEVDGVVHEFLAFGESNSEMYSVLDNLGGHLKLFVLPSDTDVVEN